MLATVVTFLMLATIITMGMLTPLIAKLTTGAELSLESSYFNNRAAIPVTILVLLLSTCMLVGYANRKHIVPIVGGTAALSILFAVISPLENTPMDISVPVLIVALLATFYRIIKIYSISKNDITLVKIKKLSAHVIHVGILLILLGIVLSSNMKVENSAVLGTTETGSFDGQHYQLKINSMNSYYSGEAFRSYPASSYTTEIDFDIYKNGNYFKTGQINYITDFKWGQTYTTTYINRGLTEELFIAPRAIDESGGKVDIYMRTVPFINCLWGGIYLMVIGITALLLADRTNDGKATSSSVSRKTGPEGTYDRLLEQEIEKRRLKRAEGKR
ncbi:cytochrome c-type biogenesis CcmF C-terminal domain-containing protein [Methanolobus psychrotolerans]|uniref:cytochrome c-type biogenesis CcmF C-terminal domain-containing protein n=1 Tax=Methanolobus psychrotolerans TaxID=1874706 RepID=UPI001F5DFAAF|nr:cytochrome c-type biogenesis CcmF C-terminal domain-containing protein [Methanolobus psychrotolerans]